MMLADGLLQFEGLSAKLGGGLLAGTLSVDASEDIPAILLDAQLSDATIGGPLFEMPLDVTTGMLSATMSRRRRDIRRRGCWRRLAVR